LAVISYSFIKLSSKSLIVKMDLVEDVLSDINDFPLKTGGI
jgi:hypothetical protein